MEPLDREHLAELMYAAGLDTVQLGVMAGVTGQHISAIIRGERRCSPAVAEAIANALCKPLGELFCSLSDDSNNTREHPAMTPTRTRKKAAAPVPDDDDQILYFEDVVRITDLPPGTIRHLRLKGDGPPFSKRGRRLRIRKGALMEWLREYEAATP